MTKADPLDPPTVSVSPLGEKKSSEKARMKDMEEEVEEDIAAEKRKKGRIEEEGEAAAEDEDLDAHEDEQPHHDVRRPDKAKGVDSEGIARDFEVRKHKVARKPVLPTKAEIDAHVPLHLEYHSWCKHCVHGKGRSNRHLAKKEDEESLGVTWHGDYAFTSGIGYDETEEGMQASLVMYDDNKDSFFGP